MSIRAFLLGIAVVTMAIVPLRAQDVVDSVAGFFPLDIGNIWQYRYRYATTSIYSHPYTVVALGDTMMPNGKRYIRFNACPILQTRIRRNPDARYYSDFIRYDSADGSVYMYDTTRSQPSDETLAYPLRAWMTAWSKRRMEVFGDSVDAIGYPVSGGDVYNFAYKIGLVYAGLGDLSDVLYEYHELVYAKIGDREYGQFFSAPPVAADPATSLDLPFPNPFATSSAILFTLGHRDHVRLDVVSALGEEVATLVDGEMEGGAHAATLDGAGLPEGLYIVRLRTGGQILSTRVVLMR